MQRHRTPWRPRRGRPRLRTRNDTNPIPFVLYRKEYPTGWQTEMATGRHAKLVPDKALVLRKGEFRSHEQAGDWFFWETFYRPHRKRLQARERKRRQRARKVR